MFKKAVCCKKDYNRDMTLYTDNSYEMPKIQNPPYGESIIEFDEMPFFTIKNKVGSGRRIVKLQKSELIENAKTEGLNH
ncbi:MAG: hypothetical protein LBQ98_04865 [Nitrososphaerota archaeon]|jgi:hypothetical protein|nr:hypothetical protein [Nitrososphaerota archaeon]